MTILEQLLRDPLTYVILAALWVGRLYVQRRVSAGVDQRFAERLEQHKASLALVAEEARFDYQRRLADFNVFAAKKHDAAAKVWEAMRIAHGAVAGLYGMGYELTFEEFNDQDMRVYLEGEEVPKGKQDEILSLWNSNRSAALAILRPYLRLMRVHQAEVKLNNAKNTAFLNELYFPDVVIKAVDGLVGDMSPWILAARSEPEVARYIKRCTHEELLASLQNLHRVLRDFVSFGAPPSIAALETPRQV